MILFFQDSEDVSSGRILEWIYNFGETPIIINKGAFTTIKIEKIQNHTATFLVNNHRINTNQIKSIYYRRNGKVLYDELIISQNNNISSLHQKIQLDYLNSISKSKNEIIDFIFAGIPTFGNESIGRINKVISIELAKQIGFSTPNYLLTTSKVDLIEFINNYKNVIIKSQDVGFRYYDRINQIAYGSYTQVLTKEKIDLIPNTFSLSYFQEYIPKSFEIRTFFFNNKTYSNAVFSQQNSKTKIDYRNYDEDFPNREVPYVLPTNINSMIIELFNQLKINTGSIDFIFNNGSYYFLEVNPVGQFENVSILGNWYIEKEIAEFLCQNKQV